MLVGNALKSAAIKAGPFFTPSTFPSISILVVHKLPAITDFYTAPAA
jgi:hypothetical protein